MTKYGFEVQHKTNISKTGISKYVLSSLIQEHCFTRNISSFQTAHLTGSLKSERSAVSKPPYHNPEREERVSFRSKTKDNTETFHSQGKRHWRWRP